MLRLVINVHHQSQIQNLIRLIIIKPSELHSNVLIQGMHFLFFVAAIHLSQQQSKI